MANIIKFPENKSISTSIGIERNEAYNKYYGCKHRAVKLDCITKTVTCRHCGAILDPFGVLEEFANQERSFIFENARCKAAIYEFKKIQSEWKLSTREKRRIDNASQQASISLSTRLNKEENRG